MVIMINKDDLPCLFQHWQSRKTGCSLQHLFLNKVNTAEIIPKCLFCWQVVSSTALLSPSIAYYRGKSCRLLCLFLCAATQHTWNRAIVVLLSLAVVWEAFYKSSLSLWVSHLHKKPLLPGRRNNLFITLTNHTYTPGLLLVPRLHTSFSHRDVTQATPTVLHGLSCHSHSACAWGAVWCWRQTAGRYEPQ